MTIYVTMLVRHWCNSCHDNQQSLHCAAFAAGDNFCHRQQPQVTIYVTMHRVKEFVMRLLLAIMFVATTTTTPTSTSTNNECSDVYFACMAHATTQRERYVCRADYLACARRIGDE